MEKEEGRGEETEQTIKGRKGKKDKAAVAI